MDQLTRQRMVEDVTLLWTLNEVPERAMENTIAGESDETRQLTLERERQLADSFAFLSASTDDMLQVKAVCIEESSDQQGMTIRLASNTGDLSSIKESLKQLAATLERAALRVDSRTSLRQDLLRQILILDEPRILSRLRSKHAIRTRKTAGKRPLADLLSESINDPSIRGAKAKLQKVRSQSARFSETFARFEAVRGDNVVPDVSLDTFADLLYQASELDTRYLQKALYSSSTIDPTLKDFLPEAVQKLGRYYSVSLDLIAAARNSQYTIFKRILIEILEEPAVDTTSITGGLQGFEAVKKRYIGSLNRRYELRDYSQSLHAARTKFESRLSSCATPWKIHAEIQLLFYYEQNQDKPCPRLICSSKSACYLCDLFIKCHGKFYTPRTHGRLYDKWLLPEWPSDQPAASERMVTAIARFNSAIRAKIIQSLNNKQRSNPQPAESKLQLQEPWSSTSTLPQTANLQLSRDILTSTPHGVLRDPEEPQTSVSACIISGSSIKSALGLTTPAIQTENASPHLIEAPNNEEGSQTSMSDAAMRSRNLSRGDRIRHKLSPPISTLIIRTEAINLHVSWQWEPAESDFYNSKTEDTPWIQVEWLTSESQVTESLEDAGIVDVEMIASEEDKVIEDGTTSGPRPLAIRNGEHILLLQWCQRDPHV